MGLTALVAIADQSGLFQNAEMFRNRWGRKSRDRAVNAPTVCSPSRHSRSKMARRVGSANDRNNSS